MHGCGLEMTCTLQDTASGSTFKLRNRKYKKKIWKTSASHATIFVHHEAKINVSYYLDVLIVGFQILNLISETYFLEAKLYNFDCSWTLFIIFGVPQKVLDIFMSTQTQTRRLILFFRQKPLLVYSPVNQTNRIKLFQV